MTYMSQTKAEKIAQQMMNELYTNSKPRITWTQYKKKYSKTNIKGYEKHYITQQKAEKILEKYKEKLPTLYRDSLAMLWLDYCPKYYKKSIKIKTNKKIDEYKNTCKTCLGYGVWKIGDASPLGPVDFSDGIEGQTCPECGATGKHKDYWQTLDGRMIYIKHLTDNHLNNILHDIYNKKLVSSNKVLKWLLKEQKRRIKK